MFKILSISFCFLLSFSLVGQNLNAKRYTKTDSFKCEFFVSSKLIRDFFVDDSLVYFWCKAQKVFATQGGFSGRLVDGKFNKFYNSGQLAEQGSFSLGLKDGEWKYWHENGVLKQICKYHKGKITGRLFLYDANGKILKDEKYRNGKLKIKRVRKVQEQNANNSEKEEGIKLKEKIKLFRESRKSEDIKGVVQSVENKKG